jgi:hypothetical protein
MIADEENLKICSLHQSANLRNKQLMQSNLQIYQRKILFLQTLRASLNASGTFGVYSQSPDTDDPTDTQSAPKKKSRPYNAQGFHAVAEPPEPNTTNKSSDRFVATVHFTGSAAQDAQNVPQPNVPANHHGMNYPHIISLKIQREHT